MLIEDSTDFIAITDVSRVASCVFSGTVNVNGTYALPAKGLVFARWNDSAATLECDGNNIYSRQDYTGYDDIARSVNVDIAIFAVQAPPKGSFLPAGMTAQLRLNVMVIIFTPGRITRAMTILPVL
ncbi:DUF6453 family protein [Enterobacter cloacae]|uniref:DUF6453 family protein n=1 Tax=Enterobacter cloacae TaxID=550 RepID=UPI002B1F37C7|nr:DUF6453 family protein [Enterobacter cloacae]MEA5226407.1 DUF6453 family protein [Enterobacter cloacae]